MSEPGIGATRLVGLEELEYLAVGGAVLGTGGGGDPHIGKLMAAAAIRRHGKVRLVAPADLPDDALCVAVCMMGAPTVMVEKLPQGDEITAAFHDLARRLGRKADYVMCIEAGGLNSTTPFIVAATTGLPLVDGDGMGRAFPELQMVTFTLHGISATPMVLADDKGNLVTFETISNRWTERLARSATVEMGGAAMVAFYSMTGAQARAALIAGTSSLAVEIGRCLARARAEKSDAIAALCRLLHGVRLFEGRVGDVERRTIGGFARGKAVLDGMAADHGHRLVLSFQNEFLLAERDGVAVASTPDLIVLLDGDTGVPVTTETLRYGLRVVALGMPCDARWRTPEGLAVVGPRYFGYDLDFVPVEILNPDTTDGEQA